jgi:hypothetical protein
MQIVYLSNRPKILNDTLNQVNLFMPFIKSVLIICPKKLSSEFRAPDLISLSFIHEEELYIELGYKSKNDHQSINYALRSMAIKHDLIEESFIMSDDDARPIRPISIELFQSNNKHANYFFYDLEDWHYHMTEFDKGQQNTLALLKYYGLPTLAYAAHMPQIIHKKIYIEAYDTFKEYSKENAICEWTSYFNYGINKYPDRFLDTTKYMTLCWPKLPGNWPLYVRPDHFNFENYYPDLYENGSVFEGLSSIYNLDNFDLINIEKIQRLRMIECGRFIAPVQINDPWRKKSLIHKILNRLVRYMNGLTRKLLLKDRSTAFKILNNQRKSN